MRTILRKPLLACVIGVNIALIVPLIVTTAAPQALGDTTSRLSGWGNQLLGFDVTLPQHNVFTLVAGILHPVRIVDHGTVRVSYLLGLANFLTRGSIRTVADALVWFDIPVTARQANAIGLCRPLDSFARGSEIVIQPDPWQYGIASWYGPGFHGRLAASGEIYNMYNQTAAHRTLPMQTLVRVVAQRTGTSTIVRINDRGPYAGGRVIDLSYRAKEALGAGDLSAVYLERIDPTALDHACP